MKKNKYEDSNTEYLEFNFTESEKIFAIRTAILKSQYTMNFNQNQEKRSVFDKIDKQLQGILAEMAVKQLLDRITRKMDYIHTVRYDEVRKDGFKSPRGEFDLKIITPIKDFVFEVRSSIYHQKISYVNSFNYPIIGKYKNEKKKQEGDSDFFIRPLFMIQDNHKSIIKSLEDNTLTVFISNACSDKLMKENGYTGNLGQSKTEYNLLTPTEETNIIEFSKNLSLFLSNINQNKINNLNGYSNKITK